MPSEKPVQAGSSITPSRPAPTAHVPSCQKPLQAGPSPLGVVRISDLCAQNSLQKRHVSRGGKEATSPRLLKVKMEAKALGSKTGILNQRPQASHSCCES